MSTVESTTYPVKPAHVIAYRHRKCTACADGIATYFTEAGPDAVPYKAVCGCAQKRFEKAQANNITFDSKVRIDQRPGFWHQAFSWNNETLFKIAEINCGNIHLNQTFGTAPLAHLPAQGDTLAINPAAAGVASGPYVVNDTVVVPK